MLFTMASTAAINLTRHVPPARKNAFIFRYIGQVVSHNAADYANSWPRRRERRGIRGFLKVNPENTAAVTT